ncbi:hypothetical protein C8R45DRAFT_1054445 [Mycena sanguinolenta]|nr:hypothetical protein C8R45DRAFT_1054445 [Mycena sanguinolenta]
MVIATRVLELYRTTHIRCPQLAIQAFVRSLCDLHSVPYRPHLREQFSVAYDLVSSALGRDTPNWRLKHACPACTYKLEGEDELIFSILTTMDGNNSLKRVLRRSRTDGSEDEPTLGPSQDYFLTREQVNKWAKGRVADILPTDANNPCSDRWKNMINDVTSRMWGIFDKTGIFLALCQHGFVLVVADMISSGELVKYPLAVVDVMLDAFGLNIGDGYDIGCHFEATVKNSELGDRARNNNFRPLVGSFHGHAHNRLCQLSFLATYVKGLGLEDLEGCERYFSCSNGLAKSVRYASKFHRQQDITTFMKQIDDLETYANLSTALRILKTEPELKRWMIIEGIENYDTFHVWLKEEEDYLRGMEDGLPRRRQESLEMETKLQEILNSEKRAMSDGADFNPAPRSLVTRRHAIEKRNRDLEVVQDLESKLGIQNRWTSATPEWTLAMKSIKEFKYQEALDLIEKIIVERLLETTKIHQSGTGYKMRSHIAKALQARSKAMKKAIDRYNETAADMDPPRPSLNWDEVVNYGFLAEFDILRDTGNNIEGRPWTRPSYRFAMDKYFKILRAREEIKRLNIEIKRVVTWIDDEDRFLRKKEKEYMKSDPSLARFWALAKTPAFTGSVVPGIAVERQKPRRPSRETEEELEMEVVEEDRDRWMLSKEGEWEDEEDEGEEAHSEEVSSLVYQMSALAVEREEGGGVNEAD